MQLAGRAALVAVLLCAAGPVAHAALFDDEQARARIEALRKQTAATQQAVDERLAKIEADRTM